MTILVTGAGGFVGRALCRELRERDFDVRAAVRDAGRAGDLGCDVVCVPDLAARDAWAAALKGVAAIVHLAARVHVMKDTAEDPLAAFRAVNVAGSATLAHAAADAGVKRVVYVSSIKVNGEATDGAKFSERTSRARSDPYGISKWEAEQVLREMARERDSSSSSSDRPSFTERGGRQFSAAAETHSKRRAAAVRCGRQRTQSRVRS